MQQWKTIHSKIVYKNKWIKIHEDEVIQPDGKETIYAFLEKNDGVIIIAEDNKNRIYLQNEYRYPIKKYIWQLPMGVVDSNTPISSAKNELKEEANISAESWKKLGYFYSSPGHENIKIYIFHARDIKTDTVVANNGDEDIVKNSYYTVSDLKQMIVENKIECSLTLAALNLFFAYKESLSK